MKFIITEEQSIFLRRRYSEIGDLVNKFINETPPERFYKFSDYLSHIKWLVMDNYFDRIKYGDIKLLNDFVLDNFYEEIKDYYISKTS